MTLLPFLEGGRKSWHIIITDYDTHVAVDYVTRKHRHGGVSGSALACVACKSCYKPGFESRLKWASYFKKSHTAASRTVRYFTFSVVCPIVDCTRRQRTENSKKKNIQIVVGRLGWKWIEKSVIQLFLLEQNEV